MPPTLPGGITPSPSQSLDAAVDVVCAPFRTASVSCSDAGSLGKGPPQVGSLKSCYNSLIHWLNQRGGVWREKHHFDIGTKIISERKVSGSIINNKQNVERFVILLTAIQECILKEELGHSQLLIAPDVHWQSVLIDMLEGPVVLAVPGHKGFQFVACNIAPN